jgi:putative peptidoglycan lipid II flippase
MGKFSFLARTSILIAAFFGLDKILAFVRVGIISRIYTDEVGLLDVFNSANNVPDVLFALISGGALAMAFIPLMSEYLTTKSRSEAWDLFSRVANLAFIVTSSIAIIVFIFARQLVDSVIVPGFTAEQRLLVAELMRLNLVSMVIFSISGLVMASLQANQHFLLPALAPTMYNIGQIFGAMFFVPRFGIHGLVYGVILGAVLHLVIQLPALSRFGFKWTPALDLRNTGLLEALKLLFPRLLTMGGIQLIVIARDYLASLTGQEGAVTSLAYGWMIMQVPETLLGTAIATAMLPTLAELASSTREDWHSFRLTVENALRVLIALTIPVAAVMTAGINPLVRPAFGFDAETSTLITWTTRAYLITLTGFCIQEVAARSFYARKEPLFPLYAVLLRLGIFIGIGWVGVTYFEHIGAPIIAFAEVALLIESIILFGWLSRRMHEPIIVWSAVSRGVVAGLIGGMATYSVARFVPGSAVMTALLGMVIGGVVCVPIIWSEIKLFLKL